MKLALADMMPQRRRNEETGGVDTEHAFIGGMTRFGKTYLAKRILQAKRFVIVHDPKNKFHLGRGEKRISSHRELYGLPPDKYPIIVYAPDRAELRDPDAAQEYCDTIYRRGNCTAVFDELSAVCSATQIPPALQDLYARGAEMGISVIGLSQEPVRIHSLTMSQAHHFYVFYMAGAAHRDKVAGFMPINPETIEELKRYYFYYWRNDLPAIIGPCKMGDGKAGATVSLP